jgi:hypothetical protein
MAYRWTENGPAFEFATPFGVENRFLTWRGCGLLALALLIVLVVTFFENASQNNDAVVSEARIAVVLIWPHYLTALLLAVFGTLDLVRATSQRTLRVERGQPAPLMPEVPHESAGASPGAVTLMRGLGSGDLPVRRLPAAWARWMRRLGPVDAAPLVAHTYLGARLAQLLLGALLLLTLGAAMVLGLVMDKPHAATLAALLVGAVALGFAVRQALLTGPLVLSAGVVLGVGVLVFLLALGLAYGSQTVPLPNSIAQAKLPLAVGLALALGLVCDLLGLMALREQLPTEQPPRLQRQEEQVPSLGDPGKSFQELERELFRRWTEGVPNRRHLRQPPVIDRQQPTGSFKTTLFEESQPLQAPASASPGGRWLRALSAMGMAFSLAGGAAWLWLAWTQMHDTQSLWLSGVLGGAFLIAGTYAMRLGHLPWSRVELASTILWIEAEGTYQRLPTPEGAPAAARSQAVDLRVCAAQARSVFYSAAPPLLGSRTLLTWAADTQATQRWLDYLRGLGQSAAAQGTAPWTGAATGPSAAPPAVSPAARPRPRALEADAPPPVAKRPARFCSACGTPVLAGARFCQQCGNVLGAD